MGGQQLTEFGRDALSAPGQAILRDAGAVTIDQPPARRQHCIDEPPGQP